MMLVEKLLERDILVPEGALQRLSEQQKKDLSTNMDGMSDDQIEEFLTKKPTGSVRVLRSYTKKPTKRKYQDFVAHFNRRLEGITALLRRRSELQSVQSIARLQKDTQVAIIGMVWDKQETKNGHIILTLEDKTGKIKVLLSKNSKKLLELGKDIMLDEVIGVTGQCAGEIVFANDVLHADVPLSHELKKSPDEAYAIFLSDLHFGGINFYHKELETFIKWLNGEVGSDAHKTIAKKIRYFFIPGDIIEGVGIYPGQEKDLAIKDVKEQYKEFAKHISRVPDHIQVIICPGNHDAGRLAEPQFDLYADFTEDIMNLPNVTLVSNPATVRIHESEKFPGFDVLLYHGYSFIYYGNNVPSIFQAGGVNRPELIMKYLLQRRHLAPTHTSNLYIPDPTEDHLIIKDVPDFFISEHTHMSATENYRGVTMINCSCWVPITEYQKSFGLDVQPGKLHIVNLKTRQIKELGFVKEEMYDAATLRT